MRNGRILVDTHSIQAVSGEWMEGRAGLMEGRDLRRYVRGWVVDRYCGCAGLTGSGEVWTFFPPSVVGQHHPSRVTKQFISSTPCFICPRSASFAMAALPRFERLNISYDRDVWGPSKEGARFAAVPYASFKKSDMIGKAVDFTLDRDYQERRRDRDNRHRRGPQESNETFDYKHDHRDEKSFNLVDTSKAKKQSRLGNGRNQRDKQGWRHLRDRDVRNEERKKQSQQANDTRNRRYLRLMQAKRNSQRRRNWNSMDEVEAESSVAVDVSWKVVETFEFHKFEKLSKLPPKEEDLCWCGHLEYYEETYDRVQSKRPTPLKIIEDREFYYESTLNDPVIEELAESSGGKVFATDAILASIMCAARSQLSWDIVATKIGGLLFLDKRDDSSFDYFTVNETAWEPPNDKDVDNVNSKSRLSLEATTINQNFTQQILNGKVKEFDMPNPFHDAEESEGKAASVGYRYRKFNLGDTPVVCRTELHGIAMRKGAEQYMTAFALNEYDPKLSETTPWRGALDTGAGGIMANELKNNAYKIGKWTASSILAGADQMKVGFVSRKSTRDPYKHEVLGTKYYQPAKFAQQINLSVRNMWGVLDNVIEVLMKQDDGKYLLLKDPSKKLCRLYSLPEGTFSDDESDEEDDEDDDGEE